MNIRCPPSFAGGRTQMYTVIAIGIASIVQLCRGNLSLFHQHAAVHLAVLSWNSGFLSWLTLHYDLSDESPGKYRFNLKLGGTLLIALLVFVVLDMSVGHCTTSGPDTAGFGQLAWVFFGAHLKGHLTNLATGFALLAVPITQGIAMLLVAWTRLRLTFRRLQPYHWSRIVFPLVWVEEVVGIGISPRANPSLNFVEEDDWGFVQIIPLVLSWRRHGTLFIHDIIQKIHLPISK